MKSRRTFIGALCSAAAPGASAADARLAEEIARRRARWTPFDWKAGPPLPAAAAASRPRLWPGAAEWRLRAAAAPKELWQPAAPEPYEAQPPREEGNSGAPGYVLMELAAAWLSTGNDFYADTAARALERVCEYPHWGGNGKPKDTDLQAGALLMGGGIAYDVLRERLSAPSRQRILDKFARQAALMYDYHAARTSAGWEQNHTYIDRGGLWCTAVALHGEAADAGKWAELGGRALRNAAYLLNEPDGAFYENLGYWSYGFALHGLPLLYLFRHVTGEDLFAGFSALRNLKYYLLHLLLPGGRDWVNIGDAGEGTVERANLDRARYAMLAAAGEYNDPECQFLAGYFSRVGKLEPASDPWTLLFRTPGIGERDPRQSWSPMHRFTDQDLVAARSHWGDDAAHFALRCGPPLGHRMTRIYLGRELPEWKPGTGHVHPDLNGFEIYDRGEHLVVDTGYTWEKRTRDHSTVAVDGAGQTGDGQRWPAFDPLDRFGRIGAFLAAPGEYLYVKGEAANGYDAKLGLSRFDRHASMVCDAENTYFILHDELESEAPHRYEWLLIAAREAAERGAGRYRVVSGKRALTLHFLDPAGAQFRQEAVRVEPRPKAPAERGFRLSFALRAARCEFLAVLALHAAGSEGPAVERRDGAVVVTAGGWTDTYSVKAEAAGVRTDGRHAFVRQRKGAPAVWAVNDARELRFGGRELLRSAAPVSAVAGSRSAVVEAKQRTEIRLAAPDGRMVKATVGPGRAEVSYT